MLSNELVITHESLDAPGAELRRLVLKGKIAGEAKPGQFVHIKVSSATDPLLRRPLSINDIDSECGEITILYRVQGKGTEILAKTRTGNTLDVLGPLGNGFSVPESGELWLAAGGIGAFPLYSLARRAMATGVATRLYWGGENRAFLESSGLKSWQELGVQLFLTTLDGSLGTKGLVTELLEQHLQEDGGDSHNKRVQVATCGPQGMLKAVTLISREKNLPVEVSLEERMGCGLGACLGCVCRVRDDNGLVRHAKVCYDGPVFRGEEVLWDAGN